MSPISDFLKGQKLQEYANSIKDRVDDGFKAMVPQAYLNDPVGGKTNWTPFTAPGQQYSGFRIDNEADVVMKPSIIYTLAVFIVLFFSLPLLFIGIVGQSLPFVLFVLISAGLTIKLFSIINKRVQTSPEYKQQNIISFDSATQSITLPAKGSASPTTLPYSEIYAVQIVSKSRQHRSSRSRVGGSSIGARSHTSLIHQLLLVKNDAQRVAISTSPNRESIRNAATKLSTHLQIPFWDASISKAEIGSRKIGLVKSLFTNKELN